jgi:6-pyruvoyltetrahydropterin/6-carboxytetrahydropterin synthase
MFELEISRTIAAAHQLRGYCGVCSRLHGHNYEIIAVLRAAELDEIGFAMDFKVLKSELDTILEGYDHAFLNDHPDFAEINPTSENLARTIYRRLGARINTAQVRVRAIRVCESGTSRATYFED